MYLLFSAALSGWHYIIRQQAAGLVQCKFCIMR
jgi:hypothetical protein